MRRLLFRVWALFGLVIMSCCQGQTAGNRPNTSAAPIGGGCDGCELMYLGMPTNIASVSISPGWKDPGQQLVVTGRVLQRDGRTPARDVVLYYWQTNAKGLYAPGEGMHPGAEKHGRIRGWVRTDATGRYEIRTIRPAPYPNDALPAHIHVVVKEPGLPNEYYIDDINFEDDTLLAPSLRKYPAAERGGSGIVRTVQQDGILVAKRDIILGLNIPSYPR